MVSINGKGNDFNLFFNNKQIAPRETKAKEVTTNIPIAQPQTKELGDKILTQNFYPGLHLSAKKVEPGSLEDLTKTLATSFKSGVSEVDNKTKVDAFYSIKDPFVQARVFGNLNENTMNTLAQLDGNSFPPDMIDDLLGDVVIS